MNLARPVYHVGFVDVVVKILRSVCFHCSRLRLDEGDVKYKRAKMIKHPKTRLNFLHEACRNKDRCLFGTGDLGLEAGIDGDASMGAPSGCGGFQPKITRKGLKVEVEYPGEMEDIPGGGDRKQMLSASIAYNILRGISDEDIKILGLSPQYSRPDWLLLTVLPVPPPHVRPSVVRDGGTAEDDLTQLLVQIVKANNSLDNCVRVGEPAHIVEQFEMLLTYRISALFDNEQAGQAQETVRKSGRPLKTIRQRLKGKEGRIRGNLMGKRVDFSARTVITADPNLGVDQVGVPKSIALNLTVPEKVTAFNQDYLAQLVSRGPHEHPGAKFIVRNDGVRVDLRYVRNKNDLSLEQGWIVERHLRDDDVIVFNRQPSLHKMSIMGHRVKVLDWSTFRMNLSVTSPYNADFDGDEMNLHVPQGLTAMAEVRELMMVTRNIVSPQSNKPVMGIVQDSLLAVAKMTKRDVFVEKDVVMSIFMWVDNWDGKLPQPAIVKPKPLWTGKQLFTAICPKVNFKATSLSAPSAADPHNNTDTQVLVHEGELLTGIIDKKSVGSSAQGLIHTSWLERGPEATGNFMNQLQKVVNNWLITTSFSIGIADTVADADTMKTIEGIIEDSKGQVQSLVAQGQNGELKTQPGKSMMESLESNINVVLNKCRDESGTSAQVSLRDNNAVKAMVQAGSKGSYINISQILACVGQQNVEGARIPYGFRRRTLPHFAKDDLGPESRGFVENSYLRGLRPQEFFFHAMGGREGLIDTAIKTAETGYIQRRLVKALETVSAKYDGTVRNHNNQVTQFLYGEDGMDGVWVEKQTFNILEMGRRQFESAYILDSDSEQFGLYPRPWLTPAALEEAKNDTGLADLLRAEAAQLWDDARDLRTIFAAKGAKDASDSTAQIPVNIARLLWNAQKTFKINPNAPTNLGPRTVVEAVQNLCKSLVTVTGSDRLSVEAQQNATLMFHILVRSSLASKRVLMRHRLDKAAFDWLIGEIRTRFLSARVAAGEMCGVLAAQSIGEPITQMTLNTFHYAGVSAKNVTLGVPRVKEIINVASTVRTPCVTIYLDSSREQDQESAKLVVDTLEYTTLGDITSCVTIHYDPEPKNTVLAEDQELVQDYFDLPDEEMEGLVERMNPWLLRFELKKEAAFVKNLQIRDVARKITSNFGSALHIICSDDNAEKLVLRIRVVDDPDSEKATVEAGLDGQELVMTGDVSLLRRLEKNLLSLQLGGIPGISKVYMAEQSFQVFNTENGWVRSTEWILETDGTNLIDVLSSPNIDCRRTVTNDVVEVLKVLGIEGARGSLLKEFRAVVERDGSYVNYRHLGILVDVMTFRGSLMAITRHGINRVDNGPMLRSSFEETVEILMDAAMFAESDNLRGVTDNIMLGQLAQVGTGCMDLMLDEKKLSNAAEFVRLDSAMGQLGVGAPLSAMATPHYTPSAFTPGMSPGMGLSTPFGAASFSPVASPFASPMNAMFSPLGAGGGSSSIYSPSYSPTSPAYSPTSPAYSPTSPAYR